MTNCSQVVSDLVLAQLPSYRVPMPPTMFEFDSVQISAAILMRSTTKATTQPSKAPLRQPDLNCDADDFLQLAWLVVVLLIPTTLSAEIA